MKITRNNVYRYSVALLGVLMISGVLLFITLFFAEYRKVDSLLGVVVLLIVIILTVYGGLQWLAIRYPYDVVTFAWNEGNLYGAHKYRTMFENRNAFEDHFYTKLRADGFEYAGNIENTLGALMAVYTRDIEVKRETLLMIETDQFTMDMLLQHRYLFKDFIEDYTKRPGLKWLKRMRTVIIVKELSVPLQILLSSREIHFKEIPNDQGAQVYAIVENEMTVYTKAHKPQMLFNEVTPWLKGYFIGTTRQVAEHVWKGVDWKDIEELHLDKKAMIILVHKALNMYRERLE